MNRCFLCAWLLLSSLWGFRAFGRSESNTRQFAVAAYDLRSFDAELHSLAAILEKSSSPKAMAALRDSLPPRWTVSTPELTCSISSEPLRNHLTARSAPQALTWVKLLIIEIEGYSAAPGADAPQARLELDRILARPEFAAAHPPGPWQLLRQRIVAWLGRQLLWLYRGVARYPVGGKILFWLFLVGVVGCMALWLFRFLAGRDGLSTLSASASPTPSMSWQEWIRAARVAASRGDFREAVHCAYWAGVVRLEDLGTLPRDRTKTPREYLRLVSEPGLDELVPRLAYREPLAVLTLRFERIWYANRSAGAEDFQESLRQLEALGCPLE